MTSSRDILRLINGVSLVAKEVLKRAHCLESARNGGDIAYLISSSVKNAVVSVTDLAGITKGKVHVFSRPKPKETVVYFSDSSIQSRSPLREETDSPSNEPGAFCYSAKEIEGKVTELENLRENHAGMERGLDISTDKIGGERSNSEDLKKKLVDLKENGVAKDPNPQLQQETQDIIMVRTTRRRQPQERRVPSTPFSRALGFAGLGAGLAWGTIQESAKRIVFGAPESEDKQSALSPLLSEKNAERFALALCRMRGAALKLGQMLSIQDESLVPAPILSALEIVRQGADVMPRTQLNQVLDNELGPEWQLKLKCFDYEPIAAASIGQVHQAVTKDGFEVAMKIQYPGVAESIESDIENVRRLLDYTNLIPKGLYLDRAMKVAKEELSQECDYELESANQKRFRELLSNTEGFYVPVVIDDISSRRVITTEFVNGIPIDKVATLHQDIRDYVGNKLLELTLKELFVFRFMQTDPNWSNFLYDTGTKMINLIDFGAAHEYPQRFVDDYLRMVLACANCDRDAVIEMSRRLGFLTGRESEAMLEAHVQAGFLVGLPFSKAGGYDFGSTNITHSISSLGATMLKHRLTPPPDDAYSLHRKLSGAFLACIKLGAVVPCRELLLQVYSEYQFRDDGVEVLVSSMS